MYKSDFVKFLTAILTLALSLNTLIAAVEGCMATRPSTTTTTPLCCPALTTTNPPRVTPPTGTKGAGLDECSILRRFSRGVCPQYAQLVCSRSPGTTVSQVIIQVVNGPTLVGDNTGPTVAMLTIECVAPGIWMYRNNKHKLFEFTGVSCNQGTLTSGDYVINYSLFSEHGQKNEGSHKGHE
ncbi:unnamed protein product [Thelazia callipaeda]|uniref:C6 domain-containing protein n=1 Tax=Thelazia callipaeda TaxID=103827 RepID=A0A0N5D894_THECL|nr:unnamed protein product [Thelazia callipaeda]